MYIQTKDGIVVEIPDGASPNGPEAKVAVGRARAEKRLAEDRERYDPTKGMSGPEKIITNIGAGMSSAIEGGKQLLGMGGSDEDLRERRARDEHLADKTTGGKLLQIAGEVAPTIPLGMGAGAVAGRAIPAAMASRAAPFVQGAAEGAAQGALVPVTGDESRLANTAVGALGGGVAPLLPRAVASTGRGVGKVAGRVLEKPLAGIEAAYGGTRFAEAGGRRALKKTLEKEGIDIAEASKNAYRPHPFMTEGPTASMATQSEKIAALERGSRAVSPDDWLPKDTRLAESRWKMLDEGLDTAEDFATKQADLKKIGEAVEKVYTIPGQRGWSAEMDRFDRLLKQAQNSPPYKRPAVKRAVDYVAEALDEAKAGGQQITPEVLHTLRQQVRLGLKGAPGLGDEGTRAVASEPFVHKLAQEMDDIIDRASKGKFGQWKDDYATQATKLESSKADLNLREVFEGQAGVGKVPPTSLDGVPNMTPHKLRQAINKFGVHQRGPKKGTPTMSTGSADVAEGVLRDLDAQNILQRVGKSGTSLGGSNTAMDLSKVLGSAVLHPAMGLTELARVTGSQRITEAQRRQLARLLQDPVALRAFLQAQALRQGPRGPVMALPGAGAGAASLLTLEE